MNASSEYKIIEAHKFHTNDKFLTALARRFFDKDARAEVAVLTLGRPSCDYVASHPEGFDIYETTFEVPQVLYNQLADRRETVEKSLSAASWQLLRRHYPDLDVGLYVSIKPEPDSRDEARRWLYKGLSNQGRVRSDAVAAYEIDGLFFRSKPEVYFYYALKGRNISFAPLPVFIRGGDQYWRVETDFVILHEGHFVVVELDGEQFHHETPVAAHERLIPLHREGAHVERIRSSECDTVEKAKTVASQVIALLKKYAANK